MKRWLILPAVFVGVLWSWCFVQMSALAWSRAVVEPLVEHNRFGIGRIIIDWDLALVEISDFGSSIYGISEDIRAASVSLRKATGGSHSVIWDIWTYSYPEGEIEIVFRRLKIPRALIKRTRTKFACRSTNSDEPCEFNGLAVVKVSADKLVHLERIEKLSEKVGKGWKVHQDLGDVVEELNASLPKARF